MRLVCCILCCLMCCALVYVLKSTIINSTHILAKKIFGRLVNVTANKTKKLLRRIGYSREWHRKFVLEVLVDRLRRSLELRHGVKAQAAEL